MCTTNIEQFYYVVNKIQILFGQGAVSSSNERLINSCFKVLVLFELSYVTGYGIYYSISSSYHELNFLSYCYVYFVLTVHHAYLIKSYHSSFAMYEQLMCFIKAHAKQSNVDRVINFLYFVLLCTIVSVMAWIYFYSESRTVEQILLYNLGLNVTQHEWYHVPLAGYYLTFMFVKNIILYMTMSMAMYVFFVYLIYTCEALFFDNCVILFVDHNNSARVAQLSKLYQQLHLIKLQFNKLYNFWPFVWMSFLFFKTSGNIVMHIRDRDNVNLAISESIAYYLILVNALISLSMSVYFVNRLKQIKQQFLRKCMYKGIDCNLNQLVHSKQFDLNGWHIFHIDKSLIIRFVANLIPFTVLFVSMSQKSR